MPQDFYLTTHQDTAAEAVRNALEAAGVAVERVIETTPETGDIIFPVTFISSLWSNETGHADCQCEDQDPSSRHLAWEDLTGLQQRAMLRHLTEFLNASWSEAYDAPTLANEAGFNDVKLGCDGGG